MGEFPNAQMNKDKKCGCAINAEIETKAVYYMQIYQTGKYEIKCVLDIKFLEKYGLSMEVFENHESFKDDIVVDLLMIANERSQVAELGFSRMVLSKYVKAGLLERSRQGVYIYQIYKGFKIILRTILILPDSVNGKI